MIIKKFLIISKIINKGFVKGEMLKTQVVINFYLNILADYRLLILKWVLTLQFVSLKK